MTSKAERDRWETKQDLDDSGYDVKPAAVRLHGKNETTKHAVIKTLLARALQKRDRRWDTEVAGPNGRVDVLDFGPADGEAVVYEVQTNCTPQDRRKKAKQYAVGPVRDVLFLDPEEAPDEMDALEDWVEAHVVG